MWIASHMQDEGRIIFHVVSPRHPVPFPNPPASRVLSAIEFLFGAFIVIGHNVFRVVPNEVIVLSVLGLISIRLRDGRLVRDRIQTTGVMAAHPSNCAGSCCLRILLGNS